MPEGRDENIHSTFLLPGAHKQQAGKHYPITLHINTKCPWFTTSEKMKDPVWFCFFAHVVLHNRV